MQKIQENIWFEEKVHFNLKPGSSQSEQNSLTLPGPRQKNSLLPNFPEKNCSLTFPNLGTLYIYIKVCHLHPREKQCVGL